MKQAAVSFKTLEEEKARMTHLMKQLHPQRNGGNRGNWYLYVTFEGANYNEEQNAPLQGAPAEGNLYFQQGPSLAESTMERYKGPSNASGLYKGSDPPDIETKQCRDTGLQHPYNREKY